MLFQLEKPEVSPEILQEQVSRFLREERPRRARLRALRGRVHRRA